MTNRMTTCLDGIDIRDMMLEPELPGGREDVHPGARTETLTAAHPDSTIRAEQPLGLGAEASRIPLKNNSDHVAASAAPGYRIVLGIDVPKPGPRFAERGPDGGDSMAWPARAYSGPDPCGPRRGGGRFLPLRRRK